MTYYPIILFVIGAIIGIAIGNYMTKRSYRKKGHLVKGALVVNTTDAMQDTYRLELESDLDELSSLRSFVIDVIHK